MRKIGCAPLRGVVLVLLLLIATVSTRVEQASSSSRVYRHAAAQKSSLAAAATTQETASSEVIAEKKTPTHQVPKAQKVLFTRGGQDLPRGLKVAVIGGLLLAFNSGYINGCCLSGLVAAKENTKQAVAAVTGAYTTSALGLAGGNLDQFISQVTILLCYIFGATIAGMLNPFPVAFGGISPSCGSSFLIGSLLLFVAGKSSSDKVTFCLAAIANGLQNSITSVHTANLIRTTHYTGISSDIGTFLGQVLRGNQQNLWKLKIFVALAFSFWTGGIFSFYAANRFHKSCLLFGSFLYFVLGSGLVRHHRLNELQKQVVVTNETFATPEPLPSSTQ